MMKSRFLSIFLLTTTTAMATDIVDVPSENFRARPDGTQVEYLVLHTVGMNEGWVLDSFTKSTAKGGLGVSAHYYVPPKGDKIVQLVDPENKVAFHAGISEWAGSAAARGQKGLNDYSVGIEIGCQDYGHFDGKTYYPYSFQTFSEVALQKGLVISKKLMKQFGIKPQNVVWHSDISPFRYLDGKLVLGKTDPSPTFPAKYYAENGVGVWPAEDREDDAQIEFSFDSFMGNLRKIGYSFNPQDKAEGLYAGQAFIMHYGPTEIEWYNFAQQQDGPVWDGKVTENMAVRAHNLATGRFKFESE